MAAKNFRLFAEALCRAEMSEAGTPLLVKVQYRGDPTEYEEWPPMSLDNVAEDGLRDPGFGSGPVSYSKVDVVSVYSKPRAGGNVELCKMKFEKLLSLVEGVVGVSVSNDRIVFRNSGD